MSDRNPPLDIPVGAYFLTNLFHLIVRNYIFCFMEALALHNPVSQEVILQAERKV